MAVRRQKSPLIVVAGQVPPPTGGQNVMIRRIVDELSGDGRWRTLHLPFFFTPSFQNVRRVRIGKILELFSVWIRFLRLRARHGKPDILIYPSGGPQTVPAVRDILLLPLFCTLSRKVIVQFHAAGIAERLAASSGLIERLLRWSYRKVAHAIVMTDFNRIDPQSLGIREISVLPHRLPDENPSGHLPDYRLCKKTNSVTRNGESNASSYQPSAYSDVGGTKTTGVTLSDRFPHTTPDPRPSAISELQPPVSDLAPHPPAFNILYAGHLYHLKGTPQLVEAFANVAPSFPSARLVLMGEFLPPYTEKMLRERCCELGIENRVEITGVLKGEKKAARFRAAHLFVFPSVAPYESFGLVMVEAMMWGLPVVATDWRGNRDVAGGAALYCPAPDPAKLSGLGSVMASALSNLHDLPALAAASRKRYEDFFCLESGGADYCHTMAGMLESQK